MTKFKLSSSESTQKAGTVQKMDIGGTINQVVPAIGLQYIATAPDIANVQNVAALEQARLAAEQKISDARAKLMPDDKAAQEFFKSASGLSGEVNSLAMEYNSERNSFYNKIIDNPDYVFSPEGKQHLRRLNSIPSNERLNQLKQNKETFDADRKKVNEKGTGDDIYFDNGFVHVEEPSTGQTIKVDASDYMRFRSDPNSQLYGAKALTINQNFNRINNRVANTRGEIPAMSSQYSYSDAVKELEQAFSDIGGTSSDTVRNAFTKFGVTNDGEPIPSIAKISSKVGGNSEQLAAAVSIVRDRLSAGARNAFSAELIRRGIDPKNTDRYVNNLSIQEAAKRTNIDKVDALEYNPIMGALKDKQSKSELESQLGFTPAAEVNSSFSADADKSWFNFWDNKQVDGFVVERNDTFPIDQSIQASVPVSSSGVYKIGGDNDSPSNDGKPVRQSVLSNVVQSRPISTYIFTGEELTQDGKPKKDQASAGKMLLTGDKGTIGVDNLADVVIDTKQDGKQYAYDPKTETWRGITRRGFRVFNGLDEDKKPNGEKYFVPMTLGESRILMGKNDRTGELATIQAVNQRGLTSVGNTAMQYLYQKIEAAQRANDAATYSNYAPKYDQIRKLYELLTNPKTTGQQKGEIINRINQGLSEIYYDMRGEEQMRNTPTPKAEAPAKSIDVLSSFR